MTRFGLSFLTTTTTTTMMLTLCLTLAALPAAAQEDANTPANANTPPTPVAPADGQTDWSVTEHSIDIAGQTINYTATAGTMPLVAEDGTPKAGIFFIAYTANPTPGSNPAQRPVMFCFNGGPGASSVWLHMGCFGPRRVNFDDMGHAVGPPYSLNDNPLSLLDTTDLVFIDPVSTGYSRAEQGTNPSEYHSVTSDINSIAEFIRLWITRNNRWLSPKYLAGESYGTTRAAGLANALQSRSIDLNGIVLVSAVLNFQTIMFDDGNDLPYQLYLPTYTALAHYHERLPGQMQQRELPELLHEVEAWSRDVYGPALMQGAALSEEERQAVAEQLAIYTALPVDLILRSDLRVPQYRFSDNLLASQGNVIGRFDGRFIGPDLDPTSDRSGASDPSYTRVAGGFAATFNDYVRTELGYETDRDYGILVGIRWDFDRAHDNYLNVSGDLREAMAENPSLRVYVAAGYYDLATPYYAAQYTIDHSITRPEAQARVTIGHYASGHMVFVHGPSLEQLRGDLVRFFAAESR